MPRAKLPILDFSGPVITRKEAKDHSLSRYFTGNSCAAGHISERRTGNGDCIICERIRSFDFAHKNLDAARTRCREWSRRNRDKKLAWNAANKERIAAKVRAWKEANPQKNNAYRRNRIARVMQATGSHTADDVDFLLEQQKYRCMECRKSITRTLWEVDHIMPLARGGSNDRRNLQILCRRCNRCKGGRDPIDHAQISGRLL